MKPDPEKYSCNLDTKERSLFFTAVSHAQQLNIIQQKQWSPDHSAKHGHRFLSEIIVTDLREQCRSIYNKLELGHGSDDKLYNKINFMPLHRSLPKRGHIATI